MFGNNSHKMGPYYSYKSGYNLYLYNSTYRGENNPNETHLFSATKRGSITSFIRIVRAHLVDCYPSEKKIYNEAVRSETGPSS